MACVFSQVSIVGETIRRLRGPWWKEWKKPIWGLIPSLTSSTFWGWLGIFEGHDGEQKKAAPTKVHKNHQNGWVDGVSLFFIYYIYIYVHITEYIICIAWFVSLVYFLCFEFEPQELFNSFIIFCAGDRWGLFFPSVSWCPSVLRMWCLSEFCWKAMLIKAITRRSCGVSAALPEWSFKSSFWLLACW